MPKRTRTSASIDATVLDAIDKKVEDGMYRNRSHAIEEGLRKILAGQES